MSAGTGVLHSEFNPLPDEPAHFLQIWIVPDHKGVTPRYAEKSATGQWQLIASKAGRDSSIAIHQDADLWLAKLDPGQRVTHALAAGRHAWVHVAEGAVILNGRPLLAGDGAGVTGEPTIDLASTATAQVLLFDLN